MIKVLLGMAVVSVCAGSALAVPLPLSMNGQASSATAIASNPADPQFAGTQVASQAVDYNVTGAGIQESGVLNEWVMRETATQTLDFYYQFEPSAGTAPDNLDLQGFGAHTLDVGFMSEGDFGPTAMSFGREPGNYFTDPPVLAMSNVPLQAIIYVRTDAKALGASIAKGVGSSWNDPGVGGVYYVSGFSAGSDDLPPTNPGDPGNPGGGGPIETASPPGVPEPMSLALLPLALAGLGVRTRRR